MLKMKAVRLKLYLVKIVTGIFCITAFLGCGEKRSLQETRTYYHHSYKGDQFSCSLDEAVENAFKTEIYAAPYETVRSAVMEILSQRGAIMNADFNESHVLIVISNIQWGIYYNSLVSVGLQRYDDKATQVLISWIDPKTRTCHKLMRNKLELEKNEKESLSPLEQRQHAAVMFGKEFFEQLSAALFGIERWRERFWKS